MKIRIDIPKFHEYNCSMIGRSTYINQLTEYGSRSLVTALPGPGSAEKPHWHECSTTMPER